MGRRRAGEGCAQRRPPARRPGGAEGAGRRPAASGRRWRSDPTRAHGEEAGCLGEEVAAGFVKGARGGGRLPRGRGGGRIRRVLDRIFVQTTTSMFGQLNSSLRHSVTEPPN